MFFAVHGVTASPKKAPPSSGIESPVKVLRVDGKSKILTEHTVLLLLMLSALCQLTQ